MSQIEKALNKAANVLIGLKTPDREIDGPAPELTKDDLKRKSKLSPSKSGHLGIK